MANIPQRNPESGAAGGSHYTPTSGSAEPYADTNRFGSTQVGETRNIMLPQNMVSDPVWGVNGYAGGIKDCESPSIPVTKGE